MAHVKLDSPLQFQLPLVREPRLIYIHYTMSYPLGSFPRFGHQERWAQERRQRAIANSIATRQAQKRARVLREACEILAFKNVTEWINEQLKGQSLPEEYAQLAKSIGDRVTRMIDGYSGDKYYRKRIDRAVTDIKQLLDRANGSGERFVEHWQFATERIMSGQF